MKKTAKILSFIFIFITIFACGCSRNIAYIDRNYQHNLVVNETINFFDDNGYIFDQDLTNDLWYGDGTSDNNGCGWIATYNVNKMLGINDAIPDIIKFYDTNGVILGGIFGTSMNSIIKYYDIKGFKTELINDTSLFNDKAKNADAAIVLYVNLSANNLYAHYISMYYAFDSNSIARFMVYNYFATGNTSSMSWILNVSSNYRSWQMLTISNP